MNERIKRLIDEAVKFRLDPDSNSYEAQVSPEDLEVFAELMIRECADLVVDDDNAFDILKHFGVK